MTATPCPWATDFNAMAGTQPVGTYFKELDRMQLQGPCLHSNIGDGFWILTKYSDILHGYRDWRTFSSASVTFLTADPPFMWIPEMLDPPTHTTWRRLLKPFFSPRRVMAMKAAIRQQCVDIINEFAEAGSCDFVTEFAGRYPTTVFLDFLGLPPAQLDVFMAWKHAIMHLPFTEQKFAESLHAMNEVTCYFDELIKTRRRDPRDDIVSAITSWEIDGKQIPHADILALFLLLFMAGMDTVAAQLSYAFWHLATHEEDRSLIVDEPTVIPSAVEEFLRFHTISNPARKAARDIDFQGCPIKAGDMVWLPLALANRDPAAFPQADQIILARTPNNHLGFGAGSHHCLGAHLARLELRIALEEWHKRIPVYQVTAGAQVLEHGGQTFGIDTLPLSWHS